MAEVAFSRAQGRVRILFPDDMPLDEVRDAIVNHMSVAILAQRKFREGEPSNPPSSGDQKRSLMEPDT